MSVGTNDFALARLVILAATQVLEEKGELVFETEQSMITLKFDALFNVLLEEVLQGVFCEFYDYIKQSLDIQQLKTGELLVKMTFKDNSPVHNAR